MSSAASKNDGIRPFDTIAHDTKELRLVQNAQVWDLRTETFDFQSLLWTNGEDFFCSTYPWRLLPEDISPLRSHVHLIPRTFYQPAIPSDGCLTPAPCPLSEDKHFIKRCIPLQYQAGEPPNTECADSLLQEARICEMLAKHPHRHICAYYGYVGENGIITGLCFAKHQKTLYDAVKDGDALNMPLILEGLKSGLDHLHALGLVHGDMNPSNILLDSDAMSTPIIIDFDSCLLQGSRIVAKGGTFPWCPEPSPDTAEFEIDVFGLKRIKEWFEEKGMKAADP